MRLFFQTTMVVACAVSLAACGETVDGPPASEIESALKIDMPAGIEVSSVDLEAAENVGSEIEPKYRSRSRIKLRLTEDFYDRVGMVGDTALVKKTASRGDEISGILITQAEPAGENDWTVDIERLQVPNTRGQAESSFGSGGFVLENSDEHKQLVEEETAREAEEQRAQEAEEDAQRRAYFGTWQSSQPALYRRDVYLHDGKQLGVRLVLRAANGNVGEGTALFYAYGGTASGTAVPVSYVIADDLEKVRVTFPQGAEYDGLGIDIGSGVTWSLSKDGTFTNSARGRGSVIAMLAK